MFVANEKGGLGVEKTEISIMSGCRSSLRSLGSDDASKRFPPHDSRVCIFLLHNMWSHKEDDVKLNIDTIHIQSLAVCVKHFAILSLVWCPNVKSGSICVQ